MNLVGQGADATAQSEERDGGRGSVGQCSTTHAVATTSSSHSLPYLHNRQYRTCVDAVVVMEGEQHPHKQKRTEGERGDEAFPWGVWDKREQWWGERMMGKVGTHRRNNVATYDERSGADTGRSVDVGRVRALASAAPTCPCV